MKIKILHIIIQLNIGGAEILVKNLLEKMNKDIYQPFVCTFTENGCLLKSFEEIGIPVFILKKEKNFDMQLIMNLRRLVRENNIDIVHTHNFQPWFYTILALMALPKLKIIHTEHSIFRDNKFKYLIMQKIFSLFTYRIIGDCNIVKESLIKNANINRSKIKTIYNGIPITYGTSVGKNLTKEVFGNVLRKETKIIGSVGRLVTDKDYETFLLAINKVIESGYDCLGFIVGDGAERANIEQKILNLGISDRFKLLGFQKDVISYLKIMDIFVLSSKKEGLPLALLEAMLNSRPVICTKVGGIEEVIQDKSNGFLVKSGDYDDIAKKIIFLINSYNKAKQIGEAGKATVLESYSITKTVQQYEDVYLEAFQKKR